MSSSHLQCTFNGLLQVHITLAVVKFWPAFKGSITQCAYLSVLWESCWVLKAWPNRDHLMAQGERLFQVLFFFFVFLFGLQRLQSWQMYPFTSFLAYWPRHNSYHWKGKRKHCYISKMQIKLFLWFFMDLLVIFQFYLVFHNFGRCV